MAMEAVMGEGRRDAVPAVRDPQVDPGTEAALIVVLSSSTVLHVDQIARAGWEGPVLAVGSVEEARQLLVNRDGGTVPTPTAAPRSRLAPAPEPLRGLRLDPDQRKVVHAGSQRTLTPLEFGVLEVLMQAPGQVRRFAELTRLVWGTSFTGDAAHLHAVVRRLRRKLEGVRAPVQLAAVRGVGFRLTAAPTPVEDPREDTRPVRGPGQRQAVPDVGPGLRRMAAPATSARMDP